MYSSDEEEVPEIDVTKYRAPSRIITTKGFEENKMKLAQKHCKNFCYFGTCWVDFDPSNFSYKGRGCKCYDGYSGERCDQRHIITLYSPIKGRPETDSEKSSHGSDTRNKTDENLISSEFLVSPRTVRFRLDLSIAAIPPFLYLFIIFFVAIMLSICTYRKLSKRHKISSWNSTLSTPTASYHYYLSPSISEESSRLMKYKILEEQFKAQRRCYDPEITPLFRPKNINPNYSAPVETTSRFSPNFRLNYSDPLRPTLASKSPIDDKIYVRSRDSVL